MMSSFRLKVVTLNVWNIPLPIPGVCKDRQRRLAALTEHLMQEKYDIAALQEMWFEDGHDLIQQKCGSWYKYTKYFARGIIGTGLLVLSRYPIYDTLFALYGPAGLPTMLHHCDFYGGKGVGLCRINADSHLVDVYITHLQAGYYSGKEFTAVGAYTGVRMAQIVQLMQFMRNTRSHGSSQILMGDLNTMPFDSMMTVLYDGVALRDAWLAVNGSEEGGATCYTMDNIYTCGQELPQRLDWILFGGSGIECKKCDVTLRRVPNDSICYSDHNGVSAEFEIRESSSSPDVNSRDKDSCTGAPIPSSVLTTANDAVTEYLNTVHLRLATGYRRLMMTLILLATLVVAAPSSILTSALCAVTAVAAAFQTFVYVVTKSEVRELRDVLSVVRLQALRHKTPQETAI